MSERGCDCETSVTKFWREERRTARKEHECGECNAIIPIGTRYLRTVGRADWGFWSFVMCLDCHELWGELYGVYGEAREELCQCLGRLQELCHEALDLDTKCYPFVQRLVQKGFLDEEDACPGSTLTCAVYDPRQLELAPA